MFNNKYIEDWIILSEDCGSHAFGLIQWMSSIGVDHTTFSEVGKSLDKALMYSSMPGLILNSLTCMKIL